MSEPTRYEACVVSGVEGPSLYLNSYRIAGPKPWGGGHTSHEWNGVTVNDLFAAFPELRALRESHAELLAAAEAVDEWFGHIHDDVPMDDDSYGQLMCEHGAESGWRRAVFANLSAAIQKAEAINAE